MSERTAVTLILGYLVCATPVHALQCYEIIPDEALEAASRVVIVQLNSIVSVADSETKFKLSFAVLDSLKGSSSARIELTLEETPWVNRSHFVEGVRYLWFLGPDQTNIGMCERILALEGRAAQWYASWQEKNGR